MTIATTDEDVLTQGELNLINQLANQIQYDRFHYELINAYYEGTMRVASLGISIPPQLERLRVVIGWPGVVVDSVEERLDVEGFRFSDGVDADEGSWETWQANDLDAESQLAHLDALIYGTAYTCVGANEKPGGQPVITVESPLDVACIWDARTHTVTSAFRDFTVGEFGLANRTKLGTLYLPDQTVSLMEPEGSGTWIVTDRDHHNLGIVPVVRMSNRARITDRRGRSEISPAIVSLTDEACRTLLGLAVSREFYAAPQRWIMGADASSFVGQDGSPKTAWETYLGKVLAIPRDDNGDLATVGQFTPYTPAAFTDVLDQYAKIMTGLTSLPAEYLGITTSNPSSADAIRMNSDRLINKVKRKQRAFASAWEQTMRLALLFQHGTVPPAALSMETLWRNPEIPTPSSTADAITKMIQAGSIPATSDVTLEHLNFTALERERLAADRDLDKGAQLIAEVSQSIIAKEARVDNTLQADVTGASTVPGTGPGGNEGTKSVPTPKP